MKASRITFLILLLIALQSVGQNVTKDSVCVSLETAKMIETDLNELDRLKENKTEENLYKCLEVQDQTKAVNIELKLVIEEKDDQLKGKNDRIKILESQLQLEGKNKKGLLWGIGGATVGIIGTLILLR